MIRRAMSRNGTASHGTGPRVTETYQKVTRGPEMSREVTPIRSVPYQTQISEPSVPPCPALPPEQIPPRI